MTLSPSRYLPPDEFSVIYVFSAAEPIVPCSKAPAKPYVAMSVADTTKITVSL